MCANWQDALQLVVLTSRTVFGWNVALIRSSPTLKRNSVHTAHIEGLLGTPAMIAASVPKNSTPSASYDMNRIQINAKNGHLKLSFPRIREELDPASVSRRRNNAGGYCFTVRHLSTSLARLRRCYKPVLRKKKKNAVVVALGLTLCR